MTICVADYRHFLSVLRYGIEVKRPIAACLCGGGGWRRGDDSLLEDRVRHRGICDCGLCDHAYVGKEERSCSSSARLGAGD